MAAATTRSRAPVGSAQWILSERKQAESFVEDEVEEFGYSVRNEIDWLNEHMHDVFANQHLNFADVFKTPGKLRGKTPRTARKRNPLETRMPLTDIFAPNPQSFASPTQIGLFSRQLPQFNVAEDADATQPNTQSTVDIPPMVPHKPVVGLGKENTDSGYHGITEDELDMNPSPANAKRSPPKRSPMKPSPKKIQETRQQTSASDIEEPQSFVSAKEMLGSKKSSREDLRDDDTNLTQDDNLTALVAQANIVAEALQAEQSTLGENTVDLVSPNRQVAELQDTEPDVDDNHSASEGSSPVKPLLRKSSLTFASLPAREPLATRVSRTSHLDQHKARGSHFGRTTGGKSLGGTQHVQNTMTVEAEISAAHESQVKESQATKQHNKTSSQQLYDRITMLGQSKDSQLAKSVTSNSFTSQNLSQQNPLESTIVVENRASEITASKQSLRDHAAKVTQSIADDEDGDEDEEDDWIAPMKPAVVASASATQNMARKRSAAEISLGSDSEDDDVDFERPRKSLTRPGFGHLKSVSTTAIPSPSRMQLSNEASHTKAISVSNPPLSAQASTTPMGSPTTKKFTDNPLSASKAKLYSVLKSAKGIFASSAGISASAKLEALSSPAPPRTAKQSQQPIQGSWEELLSPRRDGQNLSLYPDIQPAVANAERVTSNGSPGKTSEVRKTRSSAERERRLEKEIKEQQRVADELDKVRQKERQKATAFQLKQKQSKETIAELRPVTSRKELTAGQESANTSADEMPPPPPPRSMLPTTQSSKSKEVRRPAKPTKEPVKSRPAPMNIKVGVASQRLHPTTAALSASLQDSLPPPTTTKGPGSKSTQSQSSSTSSFKSSVTSQTSRPKALEVAAKKKEQEERAAARKAEQKRELERKKAEKLEQEKLAEQQRKAAEQQRVLEAKKAAQRQAAEAKRLEQQRKEAQRVPSRQANDLAHAIHNDKAHSGPAHTRNDLGTARPISRLNMIQDPPRVVPQMNPAGPAKRSRPIEGDEDQQQQQQQQQRPTMQRSGPSYQQYDGGKRRKTIDEDEDEDEGGQENKNQTRQSIKAPPMRPSTHHKPHNPFAHSYMAAASAGPAHSSMHKATVTAQHVLQHSKVAHPNDLAQISSGKIPFAQNPNPPAGGHFGQPSTHKTPVRPMGFASSKSALKSPSQFTPGETIDLPEIATDSEESDSEDGGFSAPSWVDSPNLRELLTAQQLVDPESVFGPIAQINMEEVFKNNKDRLKKFRDRTSSANWSGTDRLTEDDKKKDREGRERMMRDGGWTYGTGV